MLEKPIQESLNYLHLLVTSKKSGMMAYVPFEARSFVSNLLNVEPRKRADHDRLLNGSYFKDPQSKMNEFVELFFSKTEQQQKEFLCLVGKALIRKGDNQGYSDDNTQKQSLAHYPPGIPQEEAASLYSRRTNHQILPARVHFRAGCAHG